MAVKRMDHIGIVVRDLDAAKAFFVELGFQERGSGRVGGDLVARIVGVPGVQSDITMLKTQDGTYGIELIEFVAPQALDGDSHAPANTIGLRHICFEVDDINDTVRRLEPTEARSSARSSTTRASTCCVTCAGPTAS